jgi:cellobiose phosphorylase
MFLHLKRTHAVILDPKISSVWAGYGHAGCEIAMNDFCLELNVQNGRGREVVLIAGSCHHLYLKN